MQITRSDASNASIFWEYNSPSSPDNQLRPRRARRMGLFESLRLELYPGGRPSRRHRVRQGRVRTRPHHVVGPDLEPDCGSGGEAGDRQAGGACGSGPKSTDLNVGGVDTRTEYPVIAEPPLLAGAVQLTSAEVALAREAVPMVGVPGTVAGVTALDRVEKTPVPTAFVAWTWNLYGVPLTRPVTVRLVAPAAAGNKAPT
jgi:hypothetical protein